MRARSITALCPRILRPIARSSALLLAWVSLLLAASACVLSPRENSLRAARRQAARAEADRLAAARARGEDILQLQEDEEQDAVADLEARVADLVRRRRALGEVLARELATVQALEQDLAAARARKQAIDEEMEAVAAAEAERDAADARIEAAKRATEAAQAEVRDLTARQQALEAELAEVRNAATARIETLSQAVAELRAALDAAQAARGPAQEAGGAGDSGAGSAGAETSPETKKSK